MFVKELYMNKLRIGTSESFDLLPVPFSQQDLRQTEDNYLFVISVYTVLFKLFCLCSDRHVYFVKR